MKKKQIKPKKSKKPSSQFCLKKSTKKHQKQQQKTKNAKKPKYQKTAKKT